MSAHNSTEAAPPALDEMLDTIKHLAATGPLRRCEIRASEETWRRFLRVADVLTLPSSVHAIWGEPVYLDERVPSGEILYGTRKQIECYLLTGKVFDADAFKRVVLKEPSE